jgi:hypothetical protein
MIGGLKTYVAAPKDGSKAKTIVFLVDSMSYSSSLSSTLPANQSIVFGWEFKNVRLLADNYAKAGFYCYVPDVHQGDSIPLDFLQSVEPPLKTREQQTLVDKTKATATVGTTLPPWLVKDREAVSKPSSTSSSPTCAQSQVLGRSELLDSAGEGGMLSWPRTERSMPPMHATHLWLLFLAISNQSPSH